MCHWPLVEILVSEQGNVNCNGGRLLHPDYCKPYDRYSDINLVQVYSLMMQLWTNVTVYGLRIETLVRPDSRLSINKRSVKADNILQPRYKYSHELEARVGCSCSFTWIFFILGTPALESVWWWRWWQRCLPSCPPTHVGRVIMMQAKHRSDNV